MRRPRGPGGRFLTASEIAELRAKEAASKVNSSAAASSSKAAADNAAIDALIKTGVDDGAEDE